MSAFEYEALDQGGRRRRGSVEAGNLHHARALLRERRLVPVALRETTAEARGERPSTRDLALAFHGLASLVGAGVPVVRAVSGLLPSVGKPVRSLLEEARRQMVEGKPLSVALANSSGRLPEIVYGMVAAGEKTGCMPEALANAARHLEGEADLHAQVRKALAYPAVLLLAGTTSVAVITTIVIPRFAAIVADMGADLPPLTRGVLGASTWVQGNWLVLSAAGVAGIVLGRRLWSGPDGRRRWHSLLANVPGVASARLALSTARAGRALGSLLGSGLPILPALQAAAAASADLVVEERLNRVRARVADGQKLSTALEEEKALTPGAICLVGAGESSGDLATMAIRAGDLASREAERSLQVLVSLLEPALIIVFGGMVLLVAVALLQAVYAVRPEGL